MLNFHIVKVIFKAQKMLQQKGWNIQKGLGKVEQGIINPIEGLQRNWYAFFF